MASNRGEASHRRVVTESPDAREALLPSLDSWATPTERFYARSHFSDIPQGDAAWRLIVDGEVDHPLNLSLQDLASMPARSMAATLECAGNSRSYMTPPAEGIGFLHGAVGNAEWTGVSLEDLLSRAGPRRGAVEVLCEGADVGEEEEEGETVEVRFARSLPLEKAMHRDTLVAYRMNREPLRPVHGYPLRLVVPGWYGMASVKWLRRLTLLAEPFEGFFQSRRYVYIPSGEAQPRWEPVTSLKVKSLITMPRHGEVVRRGGYTVEGAAWSGEGPIARVELSIDGGESWREAELFGPEAPGAWRRWRLRWDAATSGHFVLMSRATDSAGNTQPIKVPWNFRGYANNSVHSIAVEVLAPA